MKTKSKKDERTIKLNPEDCAIIFKSENECEVYLSMIDDCELTKQEKIAMSLECLLSQDPTFIEMLVGICDECINQPLEEQKKVVNKKKKKKTIVPKEIRSIEDVQKLIADVFSND